MDKIAKALKKFTAKEKVIIKKLLLRIKQSNIFGMDIKKLKGRNDIYRARKGRIRIIFFLSKNKIKILAIEKRTDKAYNL